MTGLPALLKKAWAAEPVLVAVVPPILVTAGVITLAQSNALTAAVGSILAAAAQLAAAFGVRTAVKPAAK
jgi:hypothetical protein